MPMQQLPRRSATRAGSATPARSAVSTRRTPRAGSAVPSETARAISANTTQGPSDGAISNPQLPEIQAQQSFAYGSQKTPFLPHKLVAKEKMTLQQMAETIDVGIRKAEEHFEAQKAEAEVNFGPDAQKEARAGRWKRRSESREDSVQSSRQGSVDSQNTDTRTTRRTAVWASSVADTSNLEDIEEEDIQNRQTLSPVDVELEDERTHRGSDGPSSFPSGDFDVSYNQERGRFRPVSTAATFPSRSYSQIQRTIGTIKAAPGRTWQSSKQYLSAAYQLVPNLRPSAKSHPTEPNVPRNRSTSKYDTAPTSSLGSVLTPLAFAALLTLTLILTSVIFCSIYKAFFCDYESPSAIRANIQRFCGTCVQPFTEKHAMTSKLFDGKSDISSIVRSLNKRIVQVESRDEARHSQLANTLNTVINQQHVIEATLSDLQRSQPHLPGQPPPIAKINYCSAGNGAAIDPYLTSPTKQKQLNRLQRLVRGLRIFQKYQSRPPDEALHPWEEVGDCWCGAGIDGYAQLGILMSEMIYPTEVVIEHAPTVSSPSPGTAPKDLDIWADFSHLSPLAFIDAGLDKLPRDSVFPKMFVRIGKMTYDARPGVGHVQTFKLDINQNDKEHLAQKVVFRATSNYGADHTCFYRVRVHGVPGRPHPEIKTD